MATRISITNSVWTAITAAERALEHWFNYTSDLTVIRVDVCAPDPFAPSRRDCYVTLHFRKGPGRLFGSFQAWVLLRGDGSIQNFGEQWSPERLRIISTGRTGPGSGQAYRFENWTMSDDPDSEADTAWAEADKRRIQYNTVSA
ncbi:MAG: hypothetical protein Q8L47_02240 [bacterium]|nr:hypothetical protein [bacterium]